MIVSENSILCSAHRELLADEKRSSLLREINTQSAGGPVFDPRIDPSFPFGLALKDEIIFGPRGLFMGMHSSWFCSF